jgi:hypothetical protein
MNYALQIEYNIRVFVAFFFPLVSLSNQVGEPVEPYF